MDGFTRFRALKTAPEQWEEPESPLTEEERQEYEDRLREQRRYLEPKHVALWDEV